MLSSRFSELRNFKWIPYFLFISWIKNAGGIKHILKFFGTFPGSENFRNVCSEVSHQNFHSVLTQFHILDRAVPIRMMNQPLLSSIHPYCISCECFKKALPDTSAFAQEGVADATGWVLE